MCGVVCDTLKTPCMPAPRAHVFSTCARGAGIHGEVLNVYTVEGEGERVGGGGGGRRRGRGEEREGSSSASCFSLVKQVYFDIS